MITNNTLHEDDDWGLVQVDVRLVAQRVVEPHERETIPRQKEQLRALDWQVLHGRDSPRAQRLHRRTAEHQGLGCGKSHTAATAIYS